VVKKGKKIEAIFGERKSGTKENDGHLVNS